MPSVSIILGYGRENVRCDLLVILMLVILARNAFINFVIEINICILRRKMTRKLKGEMT